MYSMMVLIMLSLGKWRFTGKSLMLHCFAYISGITEGIYTSSFQPHYMHIVGCILCIQSWYQSCYHWVNGDLLADPQCFIALPIS